MSCIGDPVVPQATSGTCGQDSKWIQGYDYNNDRDYEDYFDYNGVGDFHDSFNYNIGDFSYGEYHQCAYFEYSTIIALTLFVGAKPTKLPSMLLSASKIDGINSFSSGEKGELFVAHCSTNISDVTSELDPSLMIGTWEDDRQESHTRIAFKKC